MTTEIGDSCFAWCGPRCDGLLWLHKQLAEVGRLETIEALTCDAVDELCNRHPRRLVISVASRLDYPQTIIDHLRRDWPEVPWAVAVSTWFDGSRRTGIGSVNHLQWPWYRWWDCWFPWLGSSHADLLGPFPRLSSLLAENPLQTIPSGIVVCDCRQTSDSWRQSICCACDRLSERNQVVAMTQLQFANWLNSDCKMVEGTEPIKWLLWDDNYLGGRVDAETTESICQLFRRLRTKLHACRLIMATSMPRWHDWQLFHQSGANDLLAKPTIGLSLARVLANASLENR